MDSRLEAEKFLEHLTGWAFSASKIKTIGMNEIHPDASQFARLGFKQENSKCYQIDVQAQSPFTIQFCKGAKGVSQILIVAI